MNLLKLHATANMLFHMIGFEKQLQETSAQVSFWPQKAGAKWGQEVNLGLALNSVAVIVGSWVSVGDAAFMVLESEQGHAEVSRPQWSTEQWEEGKEAWIAALLPAYRSSPAPHWHQSKLMTVLLLCSAVRSEMNRLCIQPNKEPWHAHRSRKWEF